MEFHIDFSVILDSLINILQFYIDSWQKKNIAFTIDQLQNYYFDEFLDGSNIAKAELVI